MVTTNMAEENYREHFDNFISVAVALKITICGIQDYVLENLKAIHQDVYRKCAIFAKCKDNCSRKHRNHFGSWCDTCKAWKKELQKINSYKNHWDKIKWEHLDTINFPLSHEQMAKTFIRDFQSVRQGRILQDISSLMSLFKNLKTINVNISDRIIDGVLKIRNQNFGHNYQLRLFAPEKRQSIRCLRDLLEVTHIACTKSAKQSIADISEIEKNETLPLWILQKYSLENIKDVQDDYVGSIEIYPNADHADIRTETFERVMQILQISEERHLQETTKVIHSISARSYCVLGVVAIIIMLIIYKSNIDSSKQSSTTNNKLEGCLSMRFEEYWKSDLDFDFYVEDLNNQSVIEREWLQDLLLKKIKISKRGIILTAGMGYGKSSFISNIICAEKSSVLQELKQSILAYHMCRYDIKLSLKPDIFIRNIAGNIVKTIPEVGNAILSDDRALDFLYSMKCAEDPISCAEFSLINPMKHLPKDKIFFIVIDALDECDTSGTNSLVTLFYRKMVFFPENIKFVFTTRNIEQLLVKFKELAQINLHNFELLNAKDIRSYIAQSHKLDQQKIDQLTEDLSGNFLYVKLKLEYCKEVGLERCENIPESLERIYCLNFERVFGQKGELFDDFIKLFEVLCSLHYPIEEGKLFRIAGFSTDATARKASQIIGNELGHFIKFSLGRISFQHKSLSDFLTNSSRKHLPFYVNKQNGHRLFASYLLESLNLTQNDNLVEIAHHVALTGETEYEDMLLDYASEWEIGRIDRNYRYLFKAATEINNYDTLRMLIKLVTSNISNVNLKNVSFDKDILSHHNINMSMAAFMAAANGNEESLGALLDFGATIEYANCDHCIIYDVPVNALYMCKYELLCGYNYMHIAAQRGHIKIVKYLINNTNILLHQTNRLNITAFQLAAEHGHIPVMEVMLRIDETLADDHSLYLAAKNGHLKAVDILLQYVEDSCLPCNGPITWRNFSTNMFYYQVVNGILQDSPQIHSKQEHKAIIYDDWRLLICETALHAATRNGHYEIVMALINKSNTALDCRLFDGSTPLMTAIKFNRTEIFKLFYKAGANYLHPCTCISEKKLDKSKLFPYELDFLVQSACPSNAVIAHLIAIYDNIEMIQFLLENGYTFWNASDAEGITPLHYAFCHNSYNFIQIFLFEKSVTLNLTAKTQNGSTPFHSAAICKSPVLYRYFKGRDGRSINTIPDSLDDLNRSILQYGLSIPVDDEDPIRIDRVGRDEFVSQLFEVILTSNHKLLNTDNNNRNILHDAAQNGNYLVVMIITNILDKNDIKSLVFQKDFNGRMPIEVAFDALPRRKSFEPIKIPHNCSLNTVFFTTCKANYSILLSPHEYFILTVSQFLHSNGNFSHINLTDLVIISIKKSRLYPILILKTYAKIHFNIISKSMEITHLVSDSSIPYIAELILDIDSSLQCNGTESHLHNVIQNDRNSRWEFSSFSFLDPLFKKYPVVYLDNCYDGDGYNLLHRSVIGGNTQTFLYLIRNGLNLWTNSRKNESLLEISIFKSPFMTNGLLPAYYNTGYRFHVLQFVLQSEKGESGLYDRHYDVNFDETATNIFDQMENSVLLNKTHMKNNLCKSGSYNLGLIHIAAAKGLHTFLQRVTEIYGVNILNCLDHYGITPLYLAKLYDQFQVLHWMKNLNITFSKPMDEAERFLIYNVLDNHYVKQNLDWICFLRYRNTHVALIKTVVEKCVEKCAHFPILVKNCVLRNETVSLYNMYKYVLYEKLVFRGYKDDYIDRMEINLKSCWKTSFSYHANDLLTLLILFGFDDKEYLYQRLMAELTYTSLENTNLTPLTSSESKKLFSVIFSDHFNHLRVLKMRQDLHTHWLMSKLSVSVSVELRSPNKFEIYLSKQIQRSVKVMFPVVIHDLEGLTLSRVCMNLANSLNRTVNCYSHFKNSTDPLLRQLRSIDTNDDLHCAAFDFLHFITKYEFSATDAAWNHTRSIEIHCQIDDIKHEVQELKILMRRTLRKISHLQIREKRLFRIDSYRKFLHLVLQNLEHYFKYKDI